jgi:predicted ATP-binding protein involved in virulence
VLGGAVPSDITDQQVQERYDAQSDLRRRLAEISVLDRSDEMPLPHRALHDWERRVLWTYLDDSEQKLSTFQTLLDRVRLLREIVNSRFLFKELVIDADRGFRFETESGEEVGPNQLSSGEQHELVLLYDLLFNVGANSLVLVDEPEISLHVGWQQQFLNDIQRIASLADLQFIVATHSPQIIHTWWDRSIALYTPPDSDAMDLAR